MGHPQAGERNHGHQGAYAEVKVVGELSAGKSGQHDATAGEYGSQLALAIKDEIRNLLVKKQDQQAEEQPGKFNYHG
jgi:hypothetical protein